MRQIIITILDRPERKEIETMIESKVDATATPRENACLDMLMPRLIAAIYPGAKSLVLGTDGDTLDDIRQRARMQADISSDIQKAGEHDAP